MSTLKQDPLILGLLLIGGAMLYSRSARAAVPAKPLGTGSMPGSAGTGLMQNLGGLLGNLFAGSNSSASQTWGGAAQYGPAISQWMLGGTNDSSYLNPANYTSDAIDNLTQYGI